MVSVVTQAEKMSRLSEELYSLKSTLTDNTKEGWRLFWAVHDAAWYLADAGYRGRQPEQINAEGTVSDGHTDKERTSGAVDGVEQPTAMPAPSAPNAEPPQTVSVPIADAGFVGKNIFYAWDGNNKMHCVVSIDVARKLESDLQRMTELFSDQCKAIGNWRELRAANGKEE